MRYAICNNYNMQETVKFNLADATAAAQEIANRDNMPAFVDAYRNGYCIEAESFKVQPEPKPLTKMEEFKKLVASIPSMTELEIKTELSIIRAGRSEFDATQQRMLEVRLNQYLVRM